MLKMKSNKVFEALGMKWSVLEKVEAGYLCIADSIGDRKFGSNNDWRESNIRKEMQELAEKIEKELGIELPEFERNLLSLDGEDEYGTCMDKVSIISFDEYRKYKKKIPNIHKWCWTLTPDSTPEGAGDSFVTVVAPSGDVFNGNCGNVNGVRPFCIFPSSIFESEEE